MPGASSTGKPRVLLPAVVAARISPCRSSRQPAMFLHLTPHGGGTRMDLRTTIGPRLIALAGMLMVGCSTAESSEESAPVLAQAADAAAVAGQFVGDWELVSFVSFRENGEAVDNDYIGRIVYDEHGNMSAVGMPRSLVERAAASGDELPRAGFAYFSTYDVHPEDGRVVHHVIGSPMNPRWVNTDLVR